MAFRYVFRLILLVLNLAFFWKIGDLSAQEVHISNQKTAYWVMGNGPDIVLIHGKWGSKFCFKEIMPSLAMHFRVWAYDVRGYGESERKGPLSWEGHVWHLKEFLDEMNLKKVTLLGYSMGGAIAQAFAILYPEQVSHLIMVDSMSFFPRERQTNLIEIQNNLKSNAIVLKWLRNLVLRYDWGLWLTSKIVNRFITARVLKKVCFNQTAVTPEIIEGYYAPLRNKDFWKHARDLLKTDSPAWIENIRSKLKNTSIPASLIWGENDTQISISVAYFLQTLFRGSQLYMIKQCGHVPPQERPQELVQIIKTILMK